MNRNHQSGHNLNIRMTEDELRTIAEWAERLAVPVSVFCRQCFRLAVPAVLAGGRQTEGTKKRDNLNIRMTDCDMRLIRECCEHTGLRKSTVILRTIRLGGPALISALTQASRAVTASIPAAADAAPVAEKKP